MKRLTDKQLLLMTIAVPVLLVGGIAWMAWCDYDKVHAAEMSEDHPEAAEITDANLWGEKRKCQEIRKEMAKLHGEADLIPKREQDVIVYREIVQRDSAILPDKALVNELTNTIDEYARVAGVSVTSSAGLNETGDPNQAIRKVPVRLALTGSFDQLLKFVNLFETMDRIVNTKQFAVAVGSRPTDDPSLPASHGITLELETYTYTPGAGLAKPVDIPGYEKRKEDPAIQKQIRQQKAARVDKYQLKPRINRRDPLVDPRRSRTGPEESGLTPEEIERLRRLVDALKVDVETLKEDVRLEQQYLQEKKYLQYVQIKALNDDKVQRLEIAVRDADPKVVLAEVRDVFQDEVKGPFERIAGERAKRAETGFQLVLRAHVAEFLEKQKAFYEAREYEKAEKVGKEFDTFLGTGNRKLAEDATPLVQEMKELARQSGVMLEFLKLNVKVEGFIRKPEGSIVLIGGKARKVGDAIDATGRCKLTGIKDEALVFQMDGYEIEHLLGKK